MWDCRPVMVDGCVIGFDGMAAVMLQVQWMGYETETQGEVINGERFKVVKGDEGGIKWEGPL